MLTLILIAAMLVGGAVALWQAYRSYPTSGSPGQDGWVSTASGPLGPADRDLIVRVRLAGLWEHPVGQQMAQRGTQQRVREIGQLISTEHLQLDVLDVNVAAALGVQLPNQPTDEQRGWMSEISAASGTDFDMIAVNRLRAAHGTVLPLLTTVRAATRNAAVREFAEQAAIFVQRHMGYLESTGLVNFDALPEAPTPTRSIVTTGGDYAPVPIALAAFGAVLVLVALVWVAVALTRRRRQRVPHVPPVQRVYTPPDPPTIRGAGMNETTGRHHIRTPRGRR